jgi:membrane-bound lytic murein transglycosylase C
MRKSIAVVLAIGVLGLSPAPDSAGDEFDDAFQAIEEEMDRTQKAVDESMQAVMQALDAQWQAMVAAEEARWKALEAEVEAKWDAFVGSTKVEWVDYSADRDARSRVNYEAGQVVVEVLIPADSVTVPAVAEPVPTKLPAEALKKIEEQVEKIVAPDPATGAPAIENQVKTADDKPLTQENAKEFVEKEVAPKAVVEPQVIKGKDGVDRRKARVVIPMIPQHLYVRAAKYKELVLREAAANDLEPQLVFAVIQTESYFNPRARSPAHAYGLMQLIPRYGALEAYTYLEGTKKIVTPEYLYVPENNVRLGVAYLHLLKTRYYGTIVDPEKREVLVVASYNWGPTAVRRKVVDKVPVDGLTASELRQELDQRAPQETRDYLVRVTNRKPIYDGLVGM